MAAERYLLDEMSVEERDAFEEHYFDCADCATDVRRGAVLAASGRAVIADEREANRSRGRGWSLRRPAWLTSVAAAVFAFVVGYQNLVTIPRYAVAVKAAQNEPAPVLEVLGWHSLLTSGARGENELVVVQSGADGGRVQHLIYVPIESEVPYPSYRVEIRDGAGKTHAAAPVTAEQARDTVPLLLGKLPPGGYVLIVEGVRDDGSRAEIERHALNIRVQ